PAGSSPVTSAPVNKYADFPTMSTITYGPGGTVSSKDVVDNPAPGCFVGAGDAMANARRITCAKPHDFEVYHTVELDTPGNQDDLANTTNDRCTAKLRDIRLVDVVVIGVMVPNQSAWNTHRRRGLCVVYAEPDPGTGKSREMIGSVADN
ncbi:septum formation family protein, partial [Kibdelosporangium lantanae]